MTDQIEVAITSDASGSSWTCCAWDARAGTNLMTYKGGGSASAHSVSFVRNEFLATANNNKPLIHIWPVNSQEQVSGARFVTPGRVTALAISPDGCYCVAGIAETVNIWQICSGKLLTVLSRHYQSVTSVRFTDDGSHFVSAGQDGMALVWNLGTVIANGVSATDVAPTYTFSDHALPVSDVYIGHGGMHAYLVTVSLDRSCRIYDLAAGKLLLNVVFPEPLTAVTMDHMDTRVLTGAWDGSIYEVNLQSPPRQKEYHMTSADTNNRFVGHRGAVTCVSCSLDGETLMSGGADESVNIWHIPSRQLVRTLAHKGPITNAFFCLAPLAMFDQDVKLQLISSNFKRMIETADRTGADTHVVETCVLDDVGADQDDDLLLIGGGGGSAAMYEGGQQQPIAVAAANGRAAGSNEDDANVLRAEIKNLKRINKELYQYSVKNILKQ